MRARIVKRNRLFQTAVTVSWLLAVSQGNSDAFHTEYDALELKCRSTISKNFSKAVTTGQKVIAGCHKGRDKTGNALDCNLLDSSNADAKGKFAKIQSKLLDGIQKACVATGINSDVLDEYVSCPEPCTTDLGLPNPLATYGQLGQCLACVAREEAETHGLATLGLPAAPLGETEQACRIAIGKFYGKYMKTVLKERAKCQNSAEKNGVLHLADSGCANADPKGKIASMLSKAETGVDSSCAAANLGVVDSCANTSVADLQACLQTETDSTSDAGVVYSYSLPPTICPAAITTYTIAGAPAVGEPLGVTRLDSGWNGIGHGQDIVHNYATSVSVTCPNSTPPCGACTVDGLDSGGEQSAAFTRCKEDPTIACSNPFGTDPVCPGLQECTYYLGPPAPLSASNTPTCGLFRLENDITGTFDPDNGDAEQHIQLRAVIHTGIALNKPCPICVGDPVPKDGVKAGVCDGGTRAGQGCDVQGFDATFAAGEGVSLDCVPAPLQNITGQGLALDLDLTTGSVSVPFDLTCDFPLNTEACACAVCSGNASQACNSDAECQATSSGTCTSTGGGTARQPNACSDLECTDIGDNRGECAAGPDVMACDGVIRANGLGYVLCSNNSECQVGAIGFDAGQCTLVETRPCFLDPIVADGAPDPDRAVMVAGFCVPPTSSTGVNSATGLPGPSRVKVELGIGRSY
jgi:hypothetical protein